MATTKIDNQLYAKGSKAVDAKLQPVETVNDLYTISLLDRYAGMIVTVLNNVYEYDEEEEEYVLISSDPRQYQLQGGVTNDKWTDISSSNIKESVETIVEQLMENKYGNVVYPTSTVYSYTESGATIYTSNHSEAEGKEGYAEYPEGFYVIEKDEEGNTVLSELVTQNKQEGTSIPIIGDDTINN